MPVEVRRTALDGVLCIVPEVFEDHRGRFVQLYDEDLYRRHGITMSFIQDDFSFSRRGVLRGIHGDDETCKLVTCLEGRIWAVAVDCDRGSAKFGAWQSFELNAENPLQILVPPRHGLGHLALSDHVVLHYKQTTTYRPGRQFTYRWDEPRFGIAWPPVADPILSRRDREAPFIDAPR